ncbi:MAG TPA: polysaccharide deacetylase family protein [Anaerolineales bacterium]|nr:polysaccharide deacetylase family protein [Anaerolineales bacterium]
MNPPLELTVIMYHYIRDRGDTADNGSGIPGMPVHAFEAQLDELSRQHTFVTWQEVRMALQGERDLPKSACLLTFDDGLRDHYLNAFKVLQDRKLSGLFFVLDRLKEEGLVLGHKIHFLLAHLGFTEFRASIWETLNSVQREQLMRAEERYQQMYPPASLDGEINRLKAVLQRDVSAETNPVLSDLFEKYIGSETETARSYYLSMDQIREMSAGGMHFGGHSRTHPWFDWIGAEQREVEIKASAAWLSQIEPGPWAFAYPYGGLCDDAPELLSKNGFIAAFTTQTQFQHTNPYFIGRLDGEELASEGQGYA